MRKGALTLTVILLILANDTIDCVAQLLMKKGLSGPELAGVKWGSLAEFMSGNITSHLMWIGILIYALNFLIWIVILSRIDLSIAAPAASTNYVTMPILAIIFLKEHVSLMRWGGVALIIAGIYFISMSARRPEKAAGA